MSDLGGAVVISSLAYVAVLLVLGGIARRAMRDRGLAEFFLAGRSLGLFVLLLTLFATQYSGNSMSGFPGQTYRQGLAYFMSVTFMAGIVTGYLLFAPRLFAIARRRRFITPTDYLAERYRSPALDYLSAAIFTLTLLNYLLAQLMAMGHAMAGLTGGRIPYWMGVAGGAAVILGYELLGGMRAVAWTDVLQGLMLLTGMLVVALLLGWEVGGPATVVAGIAHLAPDKLAIGGWDTCAVWLSNFLLLGLGAPLYPQAIQRIYAARRLGELRRALAAMAFLPLIGITTVVFVGAVGILLFPGLDAMQADQITFKVLARLVELQPLATVPVLVVMMAVVAAIMSTADSCLLSLSSIVGKDFIGRLRRIPTERLSRLTPFISTAVMVAVTVVALLRPATLWDLLVIKFEILIQLSPAFVLGTLRQPDGGGYEARDILTGLAAGLALALGLTLAGQRSLHGLHAGTLGVALNYGVCWLSRRLRRPAAPRPQAHSS